ncbi:hypothetical protein BDN70DRAFT_919700 [Pholiota conissans]|uniref:Uncharacterized protein n=1 Tax=Pholiota conissans TaxID=109636 RepID=A0A9P5Z7J4_9AGAR|nr:hypothetical protein BDN70DRAFT_919700 [Pholiota conissans]
MSESLGSNSNFHHVENFRQWPPEIMEITALLSKSLKEETYCHGADDGAKQINCMLDIVLEMSHLLETRIRTNERRYLRRPSRPVWVNLLSTLGLACSEDSVLLTDVPFLLPQAGLVGEAKETRFEGRATMLISSYIAPRRSEEEHTRLNISDDEGASLVVGRGSVNHELRKFGHHFLPFDGPFDGHILPGRGKRTDCVLPVICVADENNIYPLITSVVCQRYTWGIYLPVVGILMEDAGVTATAIIGWTSDRRSQDSSELPQVHLASASPLLPNSALGVFDLSDQVSVLRLTQFIMNLQHQFSYVVPDFDLVRTATCWRLDHMKPIDSGGFHASSSFDWRGRIVKWLDTSDSWDRNHYNPEELSEDSSVHLTVINSKILSAISSQLRVDGVPGGQTTSAEYITSTEHSPDVYTAPVFAAMKDTLVAEISSSISKSLEFNSPEPTASHYSAFSFVNLKDTLDDGRPGIERWLWERRTLRLTYLKLARYENPAEVQVNDMIDELTHTLELRWPTQWQSVNDVSDISGNVCHRELLKLFFDQYKVYASEHAHSICALLDEEFEILINHLSLFLSTVSNARRHQQDSQVKSKMRELVDLLLNLFWCNKDADRADLYFQDCRVRYAENQAVAGTLDDIGQAYLCDDIVWAQRLELSASQDNPTVERILRKKISALSKKEASIYLQPPSALDAGDRNAEPVYGIVDGIATTKVATDSNDGYRVREVILPRMVVKYQDMNSQHSENAFRQCQMCCISAVEFLVSLGVVEFPVYGLVVCGSHVSIMMAYHSRKTIFPNDPPSEDDFSSGFNVLIDENLVSFNIAEPLDAYRFAMVVHRIYLAGSQLVNLLKGKDLKKIQELERIFFCEDIWQSELGTSDSSKVPVE